MAAKKKKDSASLRDAVRKQRTPAEKLAAVRDFENRQALGLSAVQVAEKHGCSEATLYYWQKGLANQKPSAPQPRRRRGLSEKRAFVLSFKPDTPAPEILRKAKEAGVKVSHSYVCQILKEEGGARAALATLTKPGDVAREFAARGAAAQRAVDDVIAKATPEPTGNRTAPEIVKAAVAAYEKRGDKSAEDVAQEFGVNVRNLYRWASYHSAGRTGAPATNGHTINGNGAHAMTVRKQESITFEQHNEHMPAQFENALLRSRNLKLRKVITLLLEDY